MLLPTKYAAPRLSRQGRSLSGRRNIDLLAAVDYVSEETGVFYDSSQETMGELGQDMEWSGRCVDTVAVCGPSSLSESYHGYWC